MTCVSPGGGRWAGDAAARPRACSSSLTVSAERERSQEVSQERFHRFERRFGSFARTVGLPQGISEVCLTPLDRPSTALVNGDKRPLLIGVSETSISLQSTQGTDQ